MLPESKGAEHMYRISPYICCPCRLKELLYAFSGYNSTIAILTVSLLRALNWPCRKLKTVSSVAFGSDVLAELFVRVADHLEPSSVFELPNNVTMVSGMK